MSEFYRAVGGRERVRVMGLRRAAAFLLGGLSLFTFAGSAAAQDAPLDSTSVGFRYDGAGRLVGQINPDPDGIGPLHYPAVRTIYDPAGLVIRVENGELASWQSASVGPNAWPGFQILKTVRYYYDTLGQRVKVEVLGSNGVVESVTQKNYDRAGREGCTAVRMNSAIFGALPANACDLGNEGSQGPDRITRNIYDTAGQLVQIRKGVGTCFQGSTCLEQAYATYSFTPNGKQEYVIDANGNRAKFEYDGFDRLTTWILPSSALPLGFNPATQASALATAGFLNPSDYEQYGYDANGNRSSLRKRDGSTLIYQHDALDRMTHKSVPERPGLSGSHTREVYYSYDVRGLMTAARFDSTNGEGISTTYDGFGRVSSSTLTMDGLSRQLGSFYDAHGNRIRLTFPDNAYVTYAYDHLDRPQAVTGNASDWTRSYAYNAAGALASDTAGSGGATTFGHDQIGRLNSLGRDIAGGASLDDATTLNYNPASQIVQEARTNNEYAFKTRANYNRSFSPNGLNQYTAVSTNSYCYDANGNLTADGIDVYLYDIENRLVEKRAQGSGNTNCAALSYAGSLTTSLRYDPMGRLYETVGSATGTTRFLVDGDALVAEYDGAGILLRRYVHGADGKADDPIAWYEGNAMSNSALRFLYANHQGSIVLAADSAGNSPRMFRFDEYGVPQGTFALRPSEGARFLYTGQAWMPDLGMHYYKARIYSPKLGRFMQTDPIGYDDQINLYAYVANDPLNKSDPTGTETYNPNWHDPELLKEQGRRDGTFVRDVIQAFRNFGKNYNDMREANTIGGDKYFHCKANCQASAGSETGQRSAQTISNVREITDQRVMGDPRSASVDDQKANRHGQRAGENIRISTPPPAMSNGASALNGAARQGSTLQPPQVEKLCQAACLPFRPPGLDKQY